VGPNPPNAGLDGPDVTKPVPNVAILRTSNLSAPSSATTDGAGLYAFPPDMGGNVTLTPQPLALSEAECTASTTAADSAKIARYSVQLEALSASERLAADVSANAHVTSFDAALVGQRAVASSCSTYVFPVKTLTGSDWFYAPVSRNYTPLSGDAVSDFVVMLYGDVTGNWQHLGPLAEEGGSAGAGSSIGSGKLTAEGADTNGIAEATAGNLTFPKIGATASGVANSALATLYLASAPHQLANGAWQVALGLQAADGILGLDMSLQYDPARIRIQGVTTVGLASSFGSVQNDLGLEYGVGLFGISPMQGTGSFLLVTYEARQPVTGVPFQISAEANEGQIPVDFAPGLPGGPRPSRITTDE
jgi:hypothetical protein